MELQFGSSVLDTEAGRRQVARCFQAGFRGDEIFFVVNDLHDVATDGRKTLSSVDNHFVVPRSRDLVRQIFQKYRNRSVCVDQPQPSCRLFAHIL
jgi:hypothetical protein